MTGDPADISRFFKLTEGRALFAPEGIVSLEQVSELIRTAIEQAREKGASRMLVNALQLTGFPSPSVPERFWIVRGWAQAAQQRVAVAMVLQPHLIDADRFGILVAVNMGMRADVFTEPESAEAWLMSERPSSVVALIQK